MSKSTSFRREQLKRRRRALGLTCRQLGQLAGVDGSTVACIERGRFKPSAATACALLNALEQAENDSRISIRIAPEGIRPRRLRLRLTLQELADQAGVCKRTVWELEQGQPACSPTRVDGPRSATLEAINRALSTFEAEPATDIGANVRERREAAGLRLEDLAELTGVSKYAIHCIETDKARPKERTLKKLWAALETAPIVTPAEDIHRRRCVLRLTAEELAREAQISVGTLSRIENGKPCTAMVRTRLHQALERAAAVVPRAVALSGSEIREQRIALGLTQAELARRVGISQQALWSIEKRRTQPMLPTLRAIEQVLEKARPGESGEGMRKSHKLYPRANKAAKARRKKGGAGAPKTTANPATPASPGSPGRRLNPDNLEKYRLCYEAYQSGGKRRNQLKRAQKQLGERGEKLVPDINRMRLYARRYQTFLQTGKITVTH